MNISSAEEPVDGSATEARDMSTQKILESTDTSPAGIPVAEAIAVEDKIHRRTPALGLINLTPHEFVVFSGSAVILRVPPSGTTIRLAEIREAPQRHHINGIPVPTVALRYGQDDAGLPEARPGVLLLVSRVSAGAFPSRRDVVFPLDEVRAPDGTIIGCRALGSFATHVEAPC